MSAAKNKIKVTIKGREYDLDDLQDLAAIQATLVPDNWPLAKREAVKLFLAHRAELAAQFDRHFAYHFKNIVKTAIEDGQDEGGKPVVAVAFACELNFSALQVAAIGKTKMSFKRNFSSEGKPVARDINQLEFNDEGASIGVALDVKSFEKEMEPPAPAPKEDKPKRGPGRPKKDKGDGKVVAMPDASAKKD